MNHEAKLKELLRNLSSIESTLFSDASKEFIKILKSDSGTEFLRTYLQTSPKLIEISEAWESRKGKPGFFNILNLISAILKHAKDSKVAGDSRDLDNFASGLIKDKMGDFYKELNSKDAKRQNAVLLVLASIVRLNSYLAWEVAKVFDFKLPGFPKLAEVTLRAKKSSDGKRKAHSTRKSFVSFAMSFLESGTPRLLRGVVQHREMYSGVLRGLGNDDEETVVYVLSILRDRVLVPESLVPTPLRSVLFGSVTLEHLGTISGRSDFGEAAELANSVLVMACTDPVNGLMPDPNRRPSPLRGNLTRLLGLMKKLKVTEVECHKALLLAIVKGRPLFGSAYLDEFPYSLEDLASDNWFFAISLAADVVSSVGDGISFGFLDKPPSYESPHVQSILKCIVPRPLTKLVINKGLLHADYLVKHGTLKFLVEALKLLDSLVITLDSFIHSNDQMMHSYKSLKAEIQNAVQMSLPDPQVLFSLLSPLNSHSKSLESTKKRKAETEIASGNHLSANKRLKSSSISEDVDILISGVNSSEVDLSCDVVADSGDEQQPENGDVVLKCIRDLWGLHQCFMPHNDLKEEDSYFYSKILESIRFYYRTMPMSMEGLFDLFKFLPNNPLALPTILQQSLLQLLNEHVSQFSNAGTPIRTPPQMYRHLHPFIILLMGSRVKNIRERAYELAKAAMLSTGAFDSNTKEICAWFLFIPGPNGDHVYVEDVEEEIFQKLSSVIVSFLCDAVTTTGNNLYKYMQFLKHYIYDSNGGTDVLSPKVSPFTICVLEKCIRLLRSESGSFTIPQKSLISHYVCNTIKYLLDTQVNAGTLSFLVDRVLSEKLENCSSYFNNLELVKCPCEWVPLKILLRSVRDILHRGCYGIYSGAEDVTSPNDSFINTLTEITGVLRRECDSGLAGLIVGFSFSLTCARPREVLQNFPSVLSIDLIIDPETQRSTLLEVPFSVLSSILFLRPSYLTDVLELWPEMFFAALTTVSRCKEEDTNSYNSDLKSMKNASAAFARFLKVAPFCVLFSSVAQSNSLRLLEQSDLQKLLLEKVTGIQSDHLISSLCNVLFWINHTNSYYRVRSSDELLMLSEICFTLAEHLLKQVVVENMDTVQLHYAVEVSEIIFNHPAVTASLSVPLVGDINYPDSVFGETFEKLLLLSEQAVHQVDNNVLKLIVRTSELLLPMCDDKISEQGTNGGKRISTAFKSLQHKLFVIFKNKFDECVISLDFKAFVPTFYALHSLIRFISPFELLDLVNWLFSRIDLKDTAFHQSSKGNALFLCLHLACSSFDLLSEKKLNSSLGGTVSETQFDVLLFERIFFQVLEIGSRFKLDIADKCLFKAVNLIKMHEAIQHPDLPSIMVLSRAMASTPADIISYCLHNLNSTKANLLCLIAEMNPLHMSAFGFIISEIFDKSLLRNANGVEESFSFSDEELVMLLPTVFLYLKSVISKFGKQPSKPIHDILLEYGRVLFGGFSKWKVYVSGIIFDIGLDGPLTASTEEFSNIFSGSLLGKAILMVRDHLSLSEDVMKLDTRSSLFNSVCPAISDDIFDNFYGETDLHSLERPLEFVNRVVAKINFCRMLLFSDNNHSLAHVTSAIEKLMARFFRMLIKSWKVIVKKFQYDNDYPGVIDGQNISLFRFLEVFLMNCIMELTTEMNNCLTELDSLPFIEQLVKSFLRHRFGDLATLKLLRNILTSVSHGKFSCAKVIQLLLAHSRFAQSIHLPRDSLVSTQLGLVFTPLQSILRTFSVSHNSPDALNCKNDKLTSQEHPIFLELVRFVRVLFQIYAKQRELKFGEDIEINLRELVCLLLSSYGATCAEVDLELYKLMFEIKSIESTDKSSAGTVAQMDYLWGIASLNMRKELEQDKDVQSVDPSSMELFEERRRIKFRENIPIDPKLCAQTVLYFPYNRLVDGTALQKDEKANSTVMHEASSETDNPQIYNPVFILQFSIHCLSSSYIEPVEFASLGLLGITFASLSSLDDDIRKLGYTALEAFNCALKNCRKKKEIVRLRLLMLCLQNGIEKEWQRIPSIIAVFFAESSLVLLDSSHDNYSTISKYLSNSPTVNLKTIPLFQNLFWSSSTRFREDRLWILRLLYVGLNTEDDAQIYIRNSIFEAIMSFYSSPLSDNDSRELIIQVVKKAVRLHKPIWFLAQHCGLILWLSSIVTSLYGSECQDQIQYSRRQLTVVLEVVHFVTTPRNIAEWLQKHAMEQLSDLSSHLYKLLVDGVDLVKEQSILCNSILKVLKLVLKISQKRKIYQPHFTLSEEGLFQLYETLPVCSKTSCCPSMGLGLKVVLMSTPPVTILQMDKEKLSKFLSWAITTATQSNSKKVLRPEDSNDLMKSVSGNQQPKEESLVLKLLRWLAASVILGNLSRKLNKHNNDSFTEKQSLHCLRSWLGPNEQGSGENLGYGCEDLLAASILYLLQMVGFSHEFLPSSVSALCLLLLSSSSTELESVVASKIRCPVEANPTWRWSYYQPWRDLSVEVGDVKKLDEIHACERLLILASNTLLKKSGCSNFFPLKDVDNLRVHEWETSIVQFV